MSFSGLCGNIVKGAAALTAVVVALPVAGAVGTITGTGLVVTTITGGVIGGAEYIENESDSD